MPTARAFRFNRYRKYKKGPHTGQLAASHRPAQRHRKCRWESALIGYGWAIGPFQHTNTNTITYQI